jgi:hypothetical protein
MADDPNVVVSSDRVVSPTETTESPLTITNTDELEESTLSSRIKEESTEEVEEETIVPPANRDGVTITSHFPMSEKDRYGASIIFKVKSVRGASLDAVSVVEGLVKKDGERGQITEELQEANSKDYNPEKNEGKSQEQAIEEAQTKATAHEANKNNDKPADVYTPKKTEYRGVNIKLYLPVALQQNDGFNIATPELGQIGAAAAATASQGKGVLAAAGSGLKRAASSIIDLVGGNLAGDAARLASSQLAGKVPVFGSELGAAAQISGAVTVNPNVRSAFRGVALREFSFSFKFIARSKAEADMVEQIIKSFRTYAYPESIEAGGISAGYKYPDMFEIHVTHEPSSKIIGTKMKECFLKSIATNYNPSSMSFHKDGSPVEIDLALNFVEEKTLSRKDIVEGF